MADELVSVPGSDERSCRADRRSVQILLLGSSREVEEAIVELHLRQFGEVGLWSEPLALHEMQEEFLLNSDEILTSINDI